VQAQAPLAAAGQNPGAAGIAQAQVEAQAAILAVFGGDGAARGGVVPGEGEGFEASEEADEEVEEDGHTSGVRFQGGAQAGEHGREGGRGGVHGGNITNVC
jgi:hypothetical protein